MERESLKSGLKTCKCFSECGSEHGGDSVSTKATKGHTSFHLGLSLKAFMHLALGGVWKRHNLGRFILREKEGALGAYHSLP